MQRRADNIYAPCTKSCFLLEYIVLAAIIDLASVKLVIMYRGEEHIVNEVPTKSDSASLLAQRLPDEPLSLQRSYGWLAFFLGLFQLVTGTGAAAIIVVIILIWPGGDILGVLPAGATTIVLADNSARLMIAITAGSTLGAVLHSLVGLHLHAVVLRNFAPRFTGSYLIGPFAAALLGIALFALLQGGLLLLGGSAATSPSENEVRRLVLFYVAVGVLTGLAFDSVVLRFDGVARQIFGDDYGSTLAATLQQSRGEKSLQPEKEEPISATVDGRKKSVPSA